MIPKHLITTWICSPDGDRYTDAHRALFARCLTSWLRLMPDYALTIVTLGNVRELSPGLTDTWLESMLATGNYIGASQWARLRALWQHGGIYVDMDVEAITRFDLILEESFVVGHMGGTPRVQQNLANNALMASVPRHRFLAEQFAYMLRCDPTAPQFGNETGPYMLTKLLEAEGWSRQDRDERVGDILVQASRAHYPYHWAERDAPGAADRVYPETIARHHWGKSWFKRAGLE